MLPYFINNSNVTILSCVFIFLLCKLVVPWYHLYSLANWSYCESVVEQRKQPSLRGQPTAVVQYNSWQGGGLIAVSYEARKFGVKRWVCLPIVVWVVNWLFLEKLILIKHLRTEIFTCSSSMRGDEAKQVCPEIHLVQVPVARGKADLNAYRNAGSEVHWLWKLPLC